MFKKTLIAATALVAATFLAGPQAEAAPAATVKVQGAGSQVEFVRWGGHDRGRHHGRRHHRGRHHAGDHRRFRHHGALRRHGYRGFHDFRWDGRGFVTRAYHPRHGWVWVRVSGRTGRPLAYWR